MIIAHNTRTNKIDHSNTLTGLCRRHDNFSYTYLVKKKFPFTYKGWDFVKVDSFCEWYNNKNK